MACSLTLNKLVSRAHPGTLHAQRFRGCALKNISDNFKRFRPANLKGMPIGVCVCARPIFPIFFAQTNPPPPNGPPKNHHYSASLRLILVVQSLIYAEPLFPPLIPICLKIGLVSLCRFKSLENSIFRARRERNETTFERRRRPRLKEHRGKGEREMGNGAIGSMVKSCILAGREIARFVI